MLDPDNKAVAKALAIPPALLEEINAGNEEALSGLARAQLAFLMERMTMRCLDPNVSPAAMSSFLEILRKMSVGKNEAQSLGGPQVVINITRAKDRDDSVTIEGQTIDARD